MAFVEFERRVFKGEQSFIRRLAVDLNEIFAVQECDSEYDGYKHESYPQTIIETSGASVYVAETYDDVIEKLKEASEEQKREFERRFRVIDE